MFGVCGDNLVDLGYVLVFNLCELENEFYEIYLWYILGFFLKVVLKWFFVVLIGGSSLEGSIFKSFWMYFLVGLLIFMSFILLELIEFYILF